MASDTPNVTNIKPPTANELARAEITAIAGKASASDKKQVGEIIKQAKTGTFAANIFVITPPMAALLFLEHNPHNRDWRGDGPKSCREYARRMTTGQWKRNNASIGFYTDGMLEDGQHRLSAAAIAGHTLEVVVVFGIERDAIVTVDDLLIRHGADHAKLEGIQNTAVKQTIIKMAASYLVRTGDKSAALKSESEICDAIRTKNDVLEKAVELGTGSMQNIVDPVLKGVAAHSLAYLMLTNAWSEQRTREKLALFQTGVSMDGEKTPYFVAAEVIKAARKKIENKDRLSTVKELGVAVYAMIAAERGIKAVGASAFKGAVQKELPNPAYPGAHINKAA